MAVSTIDTQIFKPGLGTIQIGTYEGNGVDTDGIIPVYGNVTIFSVILNSNNQNRNDQQTV